MADVDRAHRLTGLPVLLQEFGFASAGGSFDYERGMAYLHGLGYARLADVLADPHRFLQALPADVARVVNKSPEADRAQNALSLLPHILKQWPGGSRRYAHTPEGQAAFYDSLLEQLLAYPHICGAFIYCWSDSERCYLCRAEDCPCETAWGITYIDETPKPVYDVIRKHFAAV
ncbi:MAG: hypothetical protein GX558_00570 [Clostridiales bacterium]|nr:hypothetical protein [Clostridiales bacterium]